MTEAQFQQAIVETLYLQLRGCVVAAVPNEVHETGRRAAIETAKKKARGLLPGYPDLIVHWKGCTILIEVKTEKGRVSPKQQDVHRRLREQGFGVHVVRTHADLDALIEMITGKV